MPAERFHPGSFVREEMEARGWSIETMVERSLLKRQYVEELIAERRDITPVVAHCLANAFGTGEQIWINLQDSWRNETRPGAGIGDGQL
jgi:HTH-type transcriptional regulator/antitoxin HigA